MLRQIGAIPFVFREDQTLVLMITSRTHERWIFPKGSLEGDETSGEAACREAFEEAGIKGAVLSEFSHDVQTVKNKADGPQDLIVTYLPLQFEEQFDEWPEKKRRDRHWVTIEEARRIAGGPDILRALEGFSKLIPKLQSIDSSK